MEKEPQSAFMFDWTVCTNVSDLNWSVSVCRTATYTKDRWLLALHFHANNVFYTKIQLTCPWISPLSVLIMASLLFDSSHCLNQCRRYNKLDHHQDKVDKMITRIFIQTMKRSCIWEMSSAEWRYFVSASMCQDVWLHTTFMCHWMMCKYHTINIS